MKCQMRFHVDCSSNFLCIGTEHEISTETIDVEEFNIDYSFNMLLVRAGVVSHVLETSYIIDAGVNAKYGLFQSVRVRAIEENTILFRQNMHLSIH